MQHINHNTAHLQNVDTCGLISKHPFVTNSKIYNHIWTHTSAQLRKKTTRPTGRAGYRHPSLWGVPSLLASPSRGRCGCPSCTRARAAPCKPPSRPRRAEPRCEATDTHSGGPACCPRPFPPASQGRMLSPARAGGWGHRGLRAAPARV